MPLLADWFTVFIVGCLAVISPGPNFAIILRNSLVYTRRAGVYTALGLAMGNVVHGMYCLIGIGVLITQSIVLFNTIKYLGAAYLIYIGIRSLRAPKHTTPTSALPSGRAMTRIAAVRVGFLTNLLNPKVTLFFLALFTQIVRPGTPVSVQTVYALTMVGLEFGWYALVAVLVSHHVIKDRFFAISHWVERTTGAVLIALGIRVALAPNP